ncbi:MAG TPA: hypothetical protein VLW45_08450 [Pelomicrobium sp.]|nr:hypothetical protein [Pelomicrobium sp.]
MKKTRSRVFIAVDSPLQQALLRSAVLSQGQAAEIIEPATPLAAALAAARPAPDEARVLVLDVLRLAADDTHLVAFERWRQPAHPDVRVVVLNSRKPRVCAVERHWAMTHGAAALLPGVSRARWEETLLPVLRVAREGVSRFRLDRARLASFLKVLVERANGVDHDGDARFERAAREEAAVRRWGIDPEVVTARLSAPGAIPIRDRSHRFRTVPACFVAAEAVDWLARHFQLERPQAVQVGRVLQHADLLYHVGREQQFDDDDIFFRFTADAALEKLDLDALVREMRGTGGVRTAGRAAAGRTWPGCFTGEDAVAWLTREKRLSLSRAITLGQRLVDLGLVLPLDTDAGFINRDLSYRFIGPR